MRFSRYFGTNFSRTMNRPEVNAERSKVYVFQIGICLLLTLSLLNGCAEKEPASKAFNSANTPSRTNDEPSSDGGQAVESSASSQDVVAASENSPETTVRFATFNVSFYRNQEGELQEELSGGVSLQASKIAEIIQRVRPQVLLLNEFDYDPEGKSISSFQEKFLGVSQGGHDPMNYEFVYFQSVNTGVDTELDLNQDGKTGTANDAFGFGRYPGQYGMVVLSQFPIDYDNIRTFQNFKWKDMPDANWPSDPETGKSYYDQEVKAVFRLSSKSHWDVPIDLGESKVHFLVSHPTPPVFDGKEDKNGKRNHDEIRFWADYISPSSDYHYDDKGETGGLDQDASFVIAGDLNADPKDGDSYDNAATLLTEHPRINNAMVPKSEGGAFYSQKQGKINETHHGDPSEDTGDFSDERAGNMRVDYCLPSADLKVVNSGVFWPKPDQPGGNLVDATDHRMVWIDIAK